MSGERVYSIKDGSALPLPTVSLADAGFREREDLQEWVLCPSRDPRPGRHGGRLRVRPLAGLSR